MADPGLLPVAAALERVLGGVTPLDAEVLSLVHADRRYLAADLHALRTQPPYDCSSMDGYALASEGLDMGARLRVIGESAAGRPFEGRIGQYEAVRIFTGAVLPEGADAVVMQEQTRPGLGRLELMVRPEPGRHVRRRGLDFSAGDSDLRRGMRLDPIRLALAAAYGHATVPVIRKPKVALLATGDELALPSASVAADQIVASNLYAVAGIAERNGAEVVAFEIAPDRLDAIGERISTARKLGADILVTLGGASVGDYDLVRKVLQENDFSLGFWRIAMRPGKPLIHGRIGRMSVLGLPGNPVSAIVCAILFLEPLLRAMQGDANAAADRSIEAICIDPLPANDERQDYIRAQRMGVANGLPMLKPLAIQDSSMLGALARAEALLIRSPNAPALPAGAACRALILRD